MRDREVFEKVAGYFEDSRYDLDTFLQRLARKDALTPRRAAAEWSKLAADIQAGRKQALINLYIHVPFCRQLCDYCGYFALRPRGDQIGRYLEVLAEEARFFAAALGKTRIRNVFVGGGTPSLMNARQTRYFVDNVLTPFRYYKDGQRTIECDPHTLTAEKIGIYKDSVLERVSLGVESFNDRVLDALGRADAGRETNLRALRLLKEQEFDDDLNCDLLLGLADDTTESFLGTFRRMLDVGAAKVIVYALKPVPAYLKKFYGGDPARFQEHYRRLARAVVEPMLAAAAERGYVCHSSPDIVWYFIAREEIKGSALNRYEDDSSIQPCSVLGLGSSARSRVDGRCRYAQAHRLLERFDPDEPILIGRMADARSEMVRMILTSLRNQQHIARAKFRAKFGADLAAEFGAVVQALLREGAASLDDKALRLKTAEPREILLAGMRFVGRAEIEETFGDVLRGRPEARDGSVPPAAVPRRVEAKPAAVVCYLDMGPDSRIEAAEVRALLRGGAALCFDGTGWADRKYLQSAAAGARGLGVALHGHDAELEARVTGRCGLFAGKMKGLGLLRSLSRPVVLQAAICRANLERLEEYVLHMRAEGWEDFRFHFARPQFGLPLDKSALPSYREAMPVIRRMILRNEAQWKLRISFGGIPPCMLRWGGGPELSPQLWHHLEAGYLSVAEIWRTRDARRDSDPRRGKSLLPACGECTFWGRCDGVWDGYASLYGCAEVVAVGGSAADEV
ncbi:MAG: radical SAM protein [Elusimicrobiota bacterium]